MKKYIPFITAFCFTLVLCCPVFASQGNISNVISNTFAFNLQEVKNDVLTIVGTAIPYAIGIFGILLSLRLGVKFFRRTAK